jgi:hypothetical protein
MAGIRRIIKEQQIQTTCFWDIPHHRTRRREDCQSELAWQDWVAYRQMRSGEQLQGVTWPQVLNLWGPETPSRLSGGGFVFVDEAAEAVAAADVGGVA